MIEFTQYLMPDGRKRKMFFSDLSPEAEAAAKRIVDAGLYLECEVLAITGWVSLTVSDGEQDVGIEVVPNGPPIIEAVERLLLEVDVELSRLGGQGYD